MARNRNRLAGPINRTIITRPDLADSTVAMLRSPGPSVSAPGPVRRTRALPMTGAQRDSEGRRSDWSRSASLRPWTTEMTAAWSPTVTTMPRGGVVDPSAYPTTR